MVVSVRRPKAVVFDILGTASKSGFLERILFPFLKVNLDGYISTHWLKRDFIRLYKRILDQSIEFNRQEPSTPIVLSHESSQARASLMNFINFVTENGINSPAVTQLRFKVWFEGYQQSKIRTPIYKDVPNKLRKWFAEGIKFYVFSNTWVEAQKALLRNTNHGDLTNLISGHYDNDFGLLVESDSWRRLCAEIHESPNDVLFLTKSPVEGRAASDAGIACVLVLTHRHNVKAISQEDRQRFPYVRTLNDLNWLEGSMMPTSEAPSAAASSGQEVSRTPIPTAISTNTTTVSQPLVSTGQPVGGSSAAAMSDSAAPSRSAGHSSANKASTSAANSSSSRGSSNKTSAATSGATESGAAQGSSKAPHSNSHTTTATTTGASSHSRSHSKPTGS